jgi:integrase
MPIVALTSAYVDALKKRPPATGRAEIWDAKTPGLCLRVSATGAASWSFRYRPREGGGYRRVTLGLLDDLTLADARGRASRYRVQVADGADPQGERKIRRAAASNALTFDALADRYLAEYAKPNKTSWRNDRSYLLRPREKWGDRDARSLTRRDAIDLLDGIKQAAPVSANRTQSILVTLFNWAVEDELLDVNPIAGLRKRAREKPKDRVLSDHELHVLWRALDDDPSADIAAALRLMVLTGQRPGEVAGMVRGELLDLTKPAQARWEIPAQRTKARRAHVVPLNAMARDLLAAVLRRREADGDGKAVFASRFASRTTLARHSLSRGLQRVIERLPAKGQDALVIHALQSNPPTPHDFRRSVATGLARLGIPREDRLAVLGHAAADIHGKHYDKFERLPQKRRALARWEAHLREVIAGERCESVVALGG